MKKNKSHNILIVLIDPYHALWRSKPHTVTTVVMQRRHATDCFTKIFQQSLTDDTKASYKIHTGVHSFKNSTKYRDQISSFEEWNIKIAQLLKLFHINCVSMQSSCT